MQGAELIAQLKARHHEKTTTETSDSELAAHLGLTLPAWKKLAARQDVSADYLADLMLSASSRIETGVYDEAIHPIVEFFPLDNEPTRRTKNRQLFDIRADGKPSPYRAGLRAALDEHYGVYVFYDSRGRALYVGQARKQTLWKEMNLKLVEQSHVLDSVRRVKHPAKRGGFSPAFEEDRQIAKASVPLAHIAAYISAYHVEKPLICTVESLLIRAFANDLLNKRIERFGLE